jgi:putative transcriptional regulator
MKNVLKVEWAKHNVSLEELAIRLNISVKTLIAIEEGDHMPSAILALKIAKVLNKEVEDIFTLESGIYLEEENLQYV